MGISAYLGSSTLHFIQNTRSVHPLSWDLGNFSKVYFETTGHLSGRVKPLVPPKNDFPLISLRHISTNITLYFLIFLIHFLPLALIL